MRLQLLHDDIIASERNRRGVSIGGWFRSLRTTIVRHVAHTHTRTHDANIDTRSRPLGTRTTDSQRRQSLPPATPATTSRSRQPSSCDGYNCDSTATRLRLDCNSTIRRRSLRP